MQSLVCVRTQASGGRGEIPSIQSVGRLTIIYIGERLYGIVSNSSPSADNTRSLSQFGYKVRVLDYRSRGPGFDSRAIPEKKSSGSGTGSTQPREYN
jgi:hypothetical protein